MQLRRGSMSEAGECGRGKSGVETKGALGGVWPGACPWGGCPVDTTRHRWPVATPPQVHARGHASGQYAVAGSGVSATVSSRSVSKTCPVWVGGHGEDGVVSTDAPLGGQRIRGHDGEAVGQWPGGVQWQGVRGTRTPRQHHIRTTRTGRASLRPVARIGSGTWAIL